MQKQVKRNLIIVLIVLFIIVVAIPISNHYIGFPGFDLRYMQAEEESKYKLCDAEKCEVRVGEEFIVSKLGETEYRGGLFSVVSGCWTDNKNIEEPIEIVKLEKIKSIIILDNMKMWEQYANRIIIENYVLKSDKAGDYKVTYDFCCGSCEKKEYKIKVVE